MKTINGKFHYQVKDIIEDLRQYPEDAVVFAIWHDDNKEFHERPIYKTVETMTPNEVYLYLGKDRQTEAKS
jgi:hypothetical protein